MTRVRVLNAENIVYVAAGARHVPEQGDPAPGASAGVAAPLQEQSRRPYFRRLRLDVAQRTMADIGEDLGEAAPLLCFLFNSCRIGLC